MVNTIILSSFLFYGVTCQYENYRFSPEHHQVQDYFPEIPNNDRLQLPYLLDFPFSREIYRHEIVYSNRPHRSISKSQLRTKRSPRKSLVPITRLIVDPKAQVDFPKTINNIGAVTRQTFEDEKSPMYHVRNFVGSAKNTVLAAMRMIPQNFMVPSDYNILKVSNSPLENDDIVGAINLNAANGGSDPSDPLKLANTFEKVGSALRESVRSGQDAMIHMGDMAQDARNILNTAHYTVPRVIMPYHRSIHVERPQRLRLQPPKKQTVLLSPRILDVNDEDRNRFGQNRAPFIKMGHLLDAVGVSNPRFENHVIDKIVFEERQIPKVSSYDRDSVKETLDSLETAKNVVGATSLKDFLVKMKHEMKKMVKNRKSDAIKKLQIKNRSNLNLKSNKNLAKNDEREYQEDNEVVEMAQPKVLRQFSRKRTDFRENITNENSNHEENVGASFIIQPELIKPFMGRTSNRELDNFLKTRNPQLNETQYAHLGSVLGAKSLINFEQLYNTSTTNTNDTSVGTSMHVTGPILKPFMGYASKKDRRKMLKTYNNVDYEDVCMMTMNNNDVNIITG